MGEELEVREEDGRVEDTFQNKIKYLSSTCDNLLKCLNSGVVAEDIKIKSIEEMYEHHVSELASTCMDLRTENSSLKRKICEMETSMSRMSNENEYLTWENEQLNVQMEALKRQCEEENLLKKELQAEIKCLQVNQKEINEIHSSRLKDELTSARDVRVTREEHLKRKIEDLERQSEAARDEIKVKMECLEDELMEKKHLIDLMEQKIGQSTKEQKNLNLEFQRYKMQSEDELELLYARETELEAELLIFREKYGNELDADQQANKILSLIREKGIQKMIYKKDVEELQKKVILLEKESKLSTVDETMDKMLQLRQLREHVHQLEEDLELEREQRQNATILLAQMSRDMKILLKAAKETI